MMGLLCKFGFHKRSRSRVRRDDDGWISWCRRCHVQMRRDEKGKWRVDGPREAPGQDGV
jgi:hypothetical protein